MPGLLSNKQDNASKDGHKGECDDKHVAELERMVGQQAIEIDFLKKLHEMPQGEQLKMIDALDQRLSDRRQCNLLAVNRSNVYYEPSPARDDTELANEIHELWLDMLLLKTQDNL